MRKPLIKNLTNRAFPLVFSVVVLLSFSSCTGGNPTTPKVQSSFLLDTAISITYYQSDDASAVSKAMNYCGDLEMIYSRKKEGAELYQVNEKAGEKVEISKDLYNLLSLAKEMSESTNGAFDFTLGRVSDLYQFTSDSPSVPDEETLSEVCSHSGYEKVSLWREDGKFYVQVSDNQILLDLGGIAKGYIADELKTYLTTRGVKYGIINLGGNIVLIGEKPTQSFLGQYTKFSHYIVGIQYPEKNSSQSIQSLELANTSCVTAGVYQRSFEQNGILYHHILNPETGKPTDTDLLSVTIVGEESAICDALSTTCMVLGIDAAKAYLTQYYPSYKVYFINSSYKVIQ